MFGKRIYLASKKPLFASASQRKNGVTMYFDQGGVLACVNVAIRQDFRKCAMCGNCCISFVVNEDCTYTCSACGKFPRELITRSASSFLT